jgi:hypothetical protein
MKEEAGGRHRGATSRKAPEWHLYSIPGRKLKYSKRNSVKKMCRNEEEEYDVEK